MQLWLEENGWSSSINSSSLAQLCHVIWSFFVCATGCIKNQTFHIGFVSGLKYEKDLDNQMGTPWQCLNSLTKQKLWFCLFAWCATALVLTCLFLPFRPPALFLEMPSLYHRYDSLTSFLDNLKLSRICYQQMFSPTTQGNIHVEPITVDTCVK